MRPPMLEEIPSGCPAAKKLDGALELYQRMEQGTCLETQLGPLLDENRRLKRSQSQHTRPDGLIGNSEVMLAVLRQIADIGGKAGALERTLAAVEYDRITDALKFHAGNVGATAITLSVTERILRSRLTYFHIEASRFAPARDPATQQISGPVKASCLGQIASAHLSR